MIYSGLYTIHTNLSETDPSTENYLTYATNCLETLNFYGVSIYSIGTPSFAVKQAQFYNLTGNACFLQSSPVPSFYGNIQFLQGVWFLNFTHCPSNCSNHGFCEYGSCYCNDGFFGEFCEYLLCPGSFCIYDDEFFSLAQCIFCSGYGSCDNGTCKCFGNYTGNDCSSLGCQNNCNERGGCISMYPISQCDCYGKYGGDSCNVIFCLNSCNDPNGVCDLTTGACKCVTGYYGIDCSVVGVSFAQAVKISFFIFLGIF